MVGFLALEYYTGEWQVLCREIFTRELILKVVYLVIDVFFGYLPKKMNCCKLKYMYNMNNYELTFVVIHTLVQ